LYISKGRAITALIVLEVVSQWSMAVLDKHSAYSKEELPGDKL